MYILGKIKIRGNNDLNGEKNCQKFFVIFALFFKRSMPKICNLYIFLKKLRDIAYLRDITYFRDLVEIVLCTLLN